MSRGQRRPAHASAWRHIAALAVVGWVAFWPLAHRALVASHEINPWKLSGFAMYTTYVTTKVALFEPVQGGFRLIDERNLSQGSQRALQDFRGRRSALGSWSEPDELAHALFEERPETDQLLVVVQRLWLDRDTAHIESSKVHFPYERPGTAADG